MFLGKDYKPKNRKIKRETIRYSIKRLEKQGIIEVTDKNINLTKWGRRLFGKIKSKKKTLDKKWDKKYRLVIFDIPEKKKNIRHWLREELYLLNYVQLQKSVFIGKHPLPSDIINDIRQLDIEDCVNYLLVDKVYDERRIRK